MNISLPVLRDVNVLMFLAFRLFLQWNTQSVQAKSSACVAIGDASGGGARWAPEPVPGGDPHHLQAYPHAGGRGALQTGPLHHPHLTEEPG